MARQRPIVRAAQRRDNEDPPRPRQRSDKGNEARAPGLGRRRGEQLLQLVDDEQQTRRDRTVVALVGFDLAAARSSARRTGADPALASPDRQTANEWRWEIALDQLGQSGGVEERFGKAALRRHRLARPHDREADHIHPIDIARSSQRDTRPARASEDFPAPLGPITSRNAVPPEAAASSRSRARSTSRSRPK